MTTFTYYVDENDGNNVDPGTTWAAAKQTIAGAIAQAVTDAAASGDLVIIKVSHVHDYTATAAITWTPIAGVRYSIISVDRSSGDAWTAGAKESIGASSSPFTLNSADGAVGVMAGLTLKSNTNASGTSDIVFGSLSGTTCWRAINCTFELAGASTTSNIILGTASSASVEPSKIDFVDCTFLVSGSRAGNIFLLQSAVVELVNPTFSLTGATKPAFMLSETTGWGGSFVVRDGDASGFNTTGGALFDVSTMVATKAVLENLKLSGTPTIETGSWAFGVGSILIRNCDSADTTTAFEYRTREGTLTETTTVYATGSKQMDGSNIGWQIVTTAACNEHTPFIAPMQAMWNTVTSAQTATIELANNSATSLTDTEVWMELSYPASTSFPNYANDDDRNATPFVGAAGTAQASSTNGWTGLGGTNTQQKATVAFTAAVAGLLTARLLVAKASQTLFVDPTLRVA